MWTGGLSCCYFPLCLPWPRPNRPSLWFGDEHLWANPPYNPADPHNPMIDSKGRVWLTTKIRPNQNASWCSDGTANKFADWYPRTFESYRVHFGEKPPDDIWPPAEIRFRPTTTRKPTPAAAGSALQ